MSGILRKDAASPNGPRVVPRARLDKLDLAKDIDDSVPPFDPANPDPVSGFDVPPSPGMPAPRPLGD